MTERIGMIKDAKTITDSILHELNNHQFQFEKGNYDQNDNLSSTLITQLQEYTMRNLNFGPIKLSCIQEELFLKVESQ